MLYKPEPGDVWEYDGNYYLIMDTPNPTGEGLWADSACGWQIHDITLLEREGTFVMRER